MSHHLPCGHEVLDPEQVHYCAYIQDPLLAELLKAKTPTGEAREVSHPDEFQFILVHQSCELSFSGCLYEMERAISAIQSAEIERATELVGRCRSWLLIAARQLQLLVDHLTPEDFSFFRGFLNPASGAESIRFRLIELASGVDPHRPYVGHRGHMFSFKQFLDRGPIEGEGRPKTRWWTPAMEERAAQPTLRSAFHELCELDSLSEEESSARLAALWGAELGAPLRALAEALFNYERAVKAIRKVHLNAARKHIKEAPGTGHTDGLLYLQSVLETARCFPLLSQVAEAAGSGDEP